MHRQVDKQHFSRPVLMQNSSCIQNNSLQSKMLNHQKPGVVVHLPKIHDKPFSFYSVDTKRSVGKGNKKQTPFAKVSLIQKLRMVR